MIKECNFANRKRKRGIIACLEHVGRLGSHMVADKRDPLFELSLRPAGEWRQETRRTQAVIKRLTLYTSIYLNKN